MAIVRQFLVAATAISVFVIGAAGLTASASVFSIDQFKVTKSQDNTAPLTTIFQDDFDDGIAPPSAPNFSGGNTASYFVTGTMGPENAGGSGRLLIDNNDGLLGPSLGGGTSLFSRARLLTNRDNTNTTGGLKANHRFEVSGLFDLSVIPTVSGQNFGIRLEDFSPDPVPQGDDVLALRVLKSSVTGNVIVLFTHLDFLNDTFTTLGAELLDQSQQQIQLTLSKNDATTNTISASFNYVNGGVAGATTVFGTTHDIFNGELFTRASFTSALPVPEPAMLGLFGLGLVGLGVAARRRKTV